MFQRLERIRVAMRQYTNEIQTAKLIELGFEKPCSIASVEPIYGMGGISVAKAYSIGELIEMLPMEDRAGERSMVYDGLEWVVNWDNDDGTINQVAATELIDALYDMVIKLKEKGVI
jgi:hypothetical protein